MLPCEYQISNAPAYTYYLLRLLGPRVTKQSIRILGKKMLMSGGSRNFRGLRERVWEPYFFIGPVGGLEATRSSHCHILTFWKNTMFRLRITGKIISELICWVTESFYHRTGLKKTSADHKLLFTYLMMLVVGQNGFSDQTIQNVFKAPAWWSDRWWIG